jgi:hypothetical protein
MKQRAVLAVACLLAGESFAVAESEFATRATIVSIDLKTQTMKVQSVPDDAKEKPKEYVVHWDEKSTFVKEGATWADKQTSVDVKSLAPATRIYVSITDRFFNFAGQTRDKLWIDTLKVLRQP